MRIVLAVIVIATVLGAQATADEVRILSSRGGEVGRFFDPFDGVRKTGESRRDQRAEPVGLHIRFERGALQWHLRHAPGETGISHGALD